jgi:Outer membrane protein beta-barrel domain
MRRIFVAAISVLLSVAALAQGDSTQIDTPKPKPVLTATNLPRSSDHIILQLGYTGWSGKPDSINTGGLPRTFNAYVMMDFPFKSNPHWSVALGIGIATDNMYFEETAVEITSPAINLVFRNLSDTNHFKRYKLATAYAELPLELRFSTNPDDNRRSVKIALGAKAGYLVNTHTKGNILLNKAEATLNDYKEKLYSKRYFNKYRLAGTARIGYGHFSLFGTYALTPLFREGVAPTIRPYTIGLMISGL